MNIIRPFAVGLLFGMNADPILIYFKRIIQKRENDWKIDCKRVKSVRIVIWKIDSSIA